MSTPTPTEKELTEAFRKGDDDLVFQLLAEAYQKGAVFGRSSQTGIVPESENYAARVVSHSRRPRITRVAKPGNITYCDEDCTEQKCSEAHDRREVVCRIDCDD